MKLIPLDAVLAEIEKRKHRNLLNESAFEEDIDILSFINTLKVKEVDLDKEFDKYCANLYLIDFENEPYAELFECAKYFFELGVNASNPLTWEDIKLIWNITDEIDNMPEEEFYKEALKRFKAQKKKEV